MRPQHNPYSSLRQPGIRGQANPSGQTRETIYNTQAISVTVITAQLLPGVWDYGYEINGEIRQSKMPGEGEGWFRTQNDALLFCLGYLRMLFDIGSPQLNAIDSRIITQVNPGLF